MSKTSVRSEGAGGPERGLLVGRFQPFHLGHLRVLQTIRREHPDETILLGIGSAQSSHTMDNPFSAGERMEMVLRAVEEARLDAVLPVPLLDIERHGLWVRYLASLLPPFQRVYTNNPLTRLLFEADGYEVLRPPWQDRAHLEGTRIRREMIEGDAWVAHVPASVAAYLREISGPERLRVLAGGSSASAGGAAPP